jgi:hypothetical protein
MALAGVSAKRVDQLETLFLAIAPWVDPTALDDAVADLSAGLGANIAADERAIPLQALRHIDDARHRFRPTATGTAYAHA